MLSKINCAPILLLLFTIISCSVRTGTPAINILSQDAPGQLTVEVDGVGNTKAKAEQSAKERTLTRLLYQGIPNSAVSSVRLPLVADQSSLSGKQKNEVQKLFSAQSINQYFNEMNWVDLRPIRAAGGDKIQRFTATVNYDLFRKHLEQSGVIRKFGY